MYRKVFKTSIYCVKHKNNEKGQLAKASKKKGNQLWVKSAGTGINTLITGSSS